MHTLCLNEPKPLNEACRVVRGVDGYGSSLGLRGMRVMEGYLGP